MRGARCRRLGRPNGLRNTWPRRPPRKDTSSPRKDGLDADHQYRGRRGSLCSARYIDSSRSSFDRCPKFPGEATPDRERRPREQRADASSPPCALPGAGYSSSQNWRVTGEQHPPCEIPAGVSYFDRLTEGQGFEPWVRGLPAQRFSRPSHSTALPPLRGFG